MSAGSMRSGPQSGIETAGNISPMRKFGTVSNSKNGSRLHL
jgi:hypothetical protein